MEFPKYVFVYTPGEPTNYPTSTKFTWNPETKHLGPEPSATPELLEELLNTGLVDETTTINVSEFNKKLTHFPDAISRLANIKTMRIETSQFTGWDRLYRLSSLRTLLLDEKVQGALPEGISQLANLEELTIRGKKVTSLPRDIGALPNLQKLTLVNMKLAELPAAICDLANLRSMTLSSMNATKSLPEGMERMTKLEHFKSEGLPLGSLPAGLTQHPALRTLHVGAGKVKKLADVDWPNLEELDLQGPLTQWPKRFSAPKLRTAKLGDKFKALPPIASASLQDLYVNAPLQTVDPALASVPKLSMQCAKAGYEALSESERSAFGTRLRPTWG